MSIQHIGYKIVHNTPLKETDCRAGSVLGNGTDSNWLILYYDNAISLAETGMRTTPSPAAAAAFRQLLPQLPADRLRLSSVSRTVNNVKTDGPELLAPHGVQE